MASAHGQRDPDFIDAEAIVIALTGGYFRTDTLRRTYQLVIANAEGAFPDRAGSPTGSTPDPGTDSGKAHF